jgi:hypothetical protein
MTRALPPVVRAYLSGLLLMACWLMPLSRAAQDLEPRRWTHLPVGTSVLGVGYAGQNADIYFNPVIGITDGSSNLNAWLARYSHAFDWSGMTARVDGILPYVSGSWQGLVDGEPGQRTIRSGGDPLVRLSVNFYGSPALKRQEFLDFVEENPVRTTVGASLAVSLPLGGYDPTELINVGRNRYMLRPQVGVLHERGPWSFELTGSMFLFSDNNDFVDSVTLSQDPVWALQAHVTRNFEGNFWLGAGMAYGRGGKVQLDGSPTAFEIDNLLLNLVGSYKLTRTQSMMLAWQRGRTQNDVGADFDSWLLSWAMALGA